MQDTTHQAIAAAYELGCEHARNAATWAADGNSDPESVRRLLADLEDGDPAAIDQLYNIAPNLSSQGAGDLSPYTLLDEIGCDREAISTDDFAAICDAYEDGVNDTFLETCEEELRRWVD